MVQKVKDFLALCAGWTVAAALVVFWFLSRRRSPATTIKVEPKVVPADDAEMLEEARKEGIIR